MFKVRPAIALLFFGIFVLNLNFVQAMDSEPERQSNVSYIGTDTTEPSINNQTGHVSAMVSSDGGYRIVNTGNGEICVPNRPITVSNTEEERKRLIDNYVPSLSPYQELGLKIGEGKDYIVITPAVHYKDKDGREKVVIYNSELPKVIMFFREKLKCEIEKYNEELETKKNKSWFKWLFPERRFPSKDCLLTIADKKRLIGCDGTDSKSFEIFDNSMDGLANNCVQLRNVQDYCCSELNGTRTPCAFKIDVEAINNFDLNIPWIERMDTPKNYYENVEAGFYQIANSDLSTRDEVLALDYCLDVFLKILKPRASDDQTINFCFALSRVDYYLTMLEKDKDSKLPAELEVMDKLRRKIESLYLEHRFLFVKSKSPILGITIDSGQIIAKDAPYKDGTTRNIIYIDRAEIQKNFIRRINDALDTDFSIISGETNYEGRSASELKELANKLKPNDYNEMIDKMKSEEFSLQEEADRCQAAAEAKKIKVALKVAESGINLAVSAFTGGVPGTINSVVDGNANSHAERNYNFTEQDVKDYLSEEGRRKSSQEMFNPLDCMNENNFSDPRNIVVDKCPEIKEQELIDRGFPSQPAGLSKPYFSNIGKVIQEQGLKPDDVDALLESMNKYLRSSKLRKELNLKREQREFIEAIQNNEAEYKNLFLLYVKMLRCNFGGRNNFRGAIIEERISSSDKQKLRKYFIQEIKRLDDELQ